MRPLPLLLHVLLSLALLANGIGAAMASAHAGCVHSTRVVAAVAEPPVIEPPCHGDMAPPSVPSEGDRAHHGGHDVASSADAHGDGDDCGSACENACDCACTAHAQAALMPPTLLLHASTRIAHAETFAYAYAAPALPHPVRPPIG